MSDSPQFETSVTALAGDRELYTLIGLLDAYVSVSDVLKAFNEQPRFHNDRACSLMNAETERLDNMADAVARAIEGLSPAEFERDAQVHALMRWASHWGAESKDALVTVARAVAKPVVPREAVQ
jgi:hypothetical protein